MNNKGNFNKKEIIILICMILGFMTIVTSGTYAYLSYASSIDNSITGNMGRVDLELNVTRVLPTSSNVNSILIFKYEELASNLNQGCIDEDGDYSLCQLYKINLKNKSNTVNVNVRGSLAFNNTTMPNLSWILLGNSYSSSTNYTTSMLGNKFNTANSTYKSFVDDYLLYSGDEIDFYILIWVNEIDRVQYDKGSYTGVVRFEDHKGTGVTAEFGDASKINVFTQEFLAPNALIDETLDFSKTSEQTGTNGIYMLESTADDLYPIYYYRGNVNNNLIFGGFCWKIVRTTETGGLKILYNGVASNGQCTSTETNIGTNNYNAQYRLLKHAGYMYQDGYEYKNLNLKNVTANYKYGNDVIYENGMYTLNPNKTIVTSSSWGSIYSTGLNNAHYTCFSTDTTCSEINYIYYTSTSSAYYITLSDGKKIEDALDDMLGEEDTKIVNPNEISSTIKGNKTTPGTLDHWYYTNIEQEGYDSYVEDTVWCNDRTIHEIAGWNPNGGSNRTAFLFSVYNRLDNTYTPQLTCPRNVDSFTVDDENGNGNLDYPVGLLTADEIMLAGGVHGVANSTYYINTGYDYWLGTPAGFGMDVAVVSYVSNTGVLTDLFVNNNYAVRPAISLKPGFKMSGTGDGSTTNPYIIA